jgi:hypothetical protein
LPVANVNNVVEMPPIERLLYGITSAKIFLVPESCHPWAPAVGRSRVLNLMKSTPHCRLSYAYLDGWFEGGISVNWLAAMGTMQALPIGSFMASRQQKLGFHIADVEVRESRCPSNSPLSALFYRAAGDLNASRATATLTRAAQPSI